MKYLGVIFDNRLKFDMHINNKINAAYQMLGIVKRNFIYLTPDSFVVLYKAMIRSHLRRYPFVETETGSSFGFSETACFTSETETGFANLVKPSPIISYKC